MIDPRHEELLHKQLDREATAAETAELQAALALHPEVRTRLAELEQLFGVLAAAPDLEPPADAREKILRGLRALPASPAPSSRLAALLRPLWPGLRPVYGFVAGAAVGVALMAAFGPRLRLEDGAAGALLPGSRVGKARLVDQQVVQLGDGAATFRVRSAGEAVLWAEIDLAVARAVDVEVEFDSTAMAPAGIGCARPGGVLELGEGRVSIRRASRNEYRVVFSMRSARASALVIRVEGEGIRVERHLRTSSLEGGPSS